MENVMAVILNYNSASDSIKCAGYLKKQTKRIHIVVVDNCSTDDSVKTLEPFCQDNGMILIKNKENAGFSAGNNIGLRKAAEYHCKYAMIINPDVEVRDERYIEDCIEQMERANDIVVLGTDIINMQGQHQNPMRELRYWEEVLWPIILVRNRLLKSLPYIEDYKKSGYCEKLSGCCFFLRMSFVEKINYLDDTVFMYSEEPILAATVKRQEKKEYYYADKKVYHMHKESEKGNSKNRLKMFFKSRRYYLDNYSQYGKIKLTTAKASIWLQEKLVIKKKSIRE